MNWFKSFFEESPGVGSSARLILFLAFVFCVACPIVYVLLGGKLDTEVSAFCKIVFGTSFAGKTFQSTFGEKTPPAS